MSELWVAARLLRRYKRFLADVELVDGQVVTVHCPNTGAMTGCVEEGARVWLSVSNNPKRKYPMTWEIIETAAGDSICIHSARANAVLEAALKAGTVAELSGYANLQREVKVVDGSRVDFVLSGPERCVVEVKSVTLGLSEGYGAFPDAVSKRATKHVQELMDLAKQGERAVLLLLAMHTGIDRIAPADPIDPGYGERLREAMSAGVEVLAYGCNVGPAGVKINRRLEFLDRLPSRLFKQM